MSQTEPKFAPLAIVGLSLKLPQDAITPESFWNMIVEGRCASTDFPPDRVNIDAHHNPDTSRLDSLSLRGGHFMTEDLGLFDAPFFSITATEAEAMDPQQRLVLEATYRALENAGMTMQSIAKSKTCVFTGSTGQDYLILKAKDPQYLQKWDITGTTANMIPNRISWFFDLAGPSAAIDTACSSSLLALDMTCQSIWSGVSSMGLAVGSNIILSLDSTIMMDNLGLLSKDSRCQSFDERGNGYARGEGVGVVVIKPLADALRDGDTIRSVIRASASNQDGKTPGITQPSSEMQAQLIRDTYHKAGLDMAATRYFEAHGTGTAVGDPIETKAIGSLFRQYRSPNDPLYIGSVKSNIGHLEGASGVAGVIKTVLALEKGVIPPISVNLQTLNPRIDDEFYNIRFPQTALPWPSEGLRRASVSSFGYGGSNTHVVLDDACHYLKLRNLIGNHNTVLPSQSSMCKDRVENDMQHIPCKETDSSDIQEHQIDTPKLLVWSTADEKGILRIQNTWKSHFSSTSKINEESPKFLDQLAYTLSERRTRLPWRAFSVSRASDSWTKILEQFSPALQARVSPNLAMIFSGQGAQWFGMGRQLLDVYPVFSQSIKEAGEYLQSLGCEWVPINELRRSESTSNVNKTEYSQLLCTILQVALVDLLRFLNVAPKAVLGHSSGEVAAAYCARGITRQSAWKVSYYRGNLSSMLEKTSKFQGSMLAVALSQQDTMAYIEETGKQFDTTKLILGCINSPKSVTVTGEVAQLDAMKVILDRQGVFCRRLKVNLAYHSSQMEDIADLYLRALGELESDYADHKDCPEMVSSVTGQWIGRGEAAKASHWVNNMISPVQFSAGLTLLCSGKASNVHRKLDGSHRKTMPIDHILEVGPHSALQGACKDVLKSIQGSKPTEYLSLLVRNISAVDTAFSVFGTLFATGYPIDLTRVNGHDSIKRGLLKSLPDLPDYPFNHDVRYWHESNISKNYRLRAVGRNDLLGVPDQSSNPLERRWRNFLRVSEMPWLKDHQIESSILYPGAGMLTMAIEAAKQVAEPGRVVEGFNAQEVKFHAAMRIPPGAHGLETTFYLRPFQNIQSKSSDWFEFRVCTYETEAWIENCTGIIQIVYTSSETGSQIEKQHEEELWNCQMESYYNALGDCTLPVDGSALYERLHKSGYGYGDAFQLVKKLSLSPKQSWVVADVQRFSSPAKEVIHPTTLDAILQTSIWTSVTPETEQIPTAIPTSVNNLWISNRLLSNTSSNLLKTHTTRNKETTFIGATADIVVFDETLKEALLSVQGLGSSVVGNGGNPGAESVPLGDICYNFDWKPDPKLQTNQELIDLCTRATPALPEPEDYFRDLDLLFMSRITDTLKIIFEQGISPSKPHLQKYVKWMNHQQKMLNDGQLWLSEEPWKSRVTDSKYIHEVETRLSYRNSRGLFYVNIARNLLKFLTGEIDPLEFLFEGGEMKDFYHEQFREAHGVKHIGSYLELLSHANPSMKIIEIGAGVGSMTDVMIQSLGGANEGSDRKYSQWDYTDISKSFLAGAQEHFNKEAGRMNFKQLDIEKNPEIQGFECGTYDMVVASLVFHATSSLRNTLLNARKLLKPGGKLMLCEIIAPNCRSAFTFGLLEGWWLSSESYRTHGPCVDERKWHELLTETGFSGLDLLFADFEGPISHEIGMLVSTAVEEPPTNQSVPEIEIIVNTVDPVQCSLMQLLVNEFQSILPNRVRCSSVQEALDSKDEEPLLRIFLLELHSPVLSGIEVALFDQLRNLLSSTVPVLWINQGGGVFPSKPGSRLVDGMFRVLKMENSKRSLHLLALEPHASLTRRQHQHIINLVKLLLSPSAETADVEYIEHEGMLSVPRLHPYKALNENISLVASSHQSKIQDFGCQVPLCLNTASPGLLNGFEFVEDERFNLPLGADEVEIELKCTGINFRDVLIAVGQLKTSHTGSEWSGTVTRVGNACRKFRLGDTVAGLYTGCFSTSIRMPENGPLVKISGGLSFSDAAAVPLNFATSYIALHNVAQIKFGETVLIHTASGGTGQAAVQVAKNAGATIFATVGSESKKKFLMEVYGIPESHIFSSRTTLFSKMVKHRTGGKGADVILNSLAGESLFESWKCIAPYGRFIEIGKKDILSNHGLPMLKFLENVTFSCVDLAAMAVERPDVCAAALQSVFAMIEEGKLHPSQPVNVYGVGEMEKAFRIMQAGQHVGKMVLEMRKLDQVKTVLKTKPAYSLDANATFVVSGGLGGIGKNTTCWLADHGARHLLLLSRSGGKTGKSKELIDELTARNIQVLAPVCDIANRESVENALRECRSRMPPIKGCIQAAMVLRDAVFESISHQSWHESLSPKVQGSWNLHELLPKGMDFFIMLSSLTGILGTTGQASYAAGNTFQDSMARHRVGLGEKATSLNLGVINFAGAVMEDARLTDIWIKKSKLPPVTEAHFHGLLSTYCDPNINNLTSRHHQVAVGLSSPAILSNEQWKMEPIVRHMLTNKSLEEAEEEQSNNSKGAISLLQANTLAEANTTVTELFVQKLSVALGIASADIDSNKPLHQYGVDSLVAVELRGWFSRELQAELGVFEIIGGATMASVAQLATRKSKLVKVSK